MYTGGDWERTSLDEYFIICVKKTKQNKKFCICLHIPSHDILCPCVNNVFTSSQTHSSTLCLSAAVTLILSGKYTKSKSLFKDLAGANVYRREECVQSQTITP